MPSSIGHAAAALAIGAALEPQTPSRRFWISLAGGAVVLDIDAIGRVFGRGDIQWLGGHRALTHSIPFAMLLAAVIVVLGFRSRRWHGRRRRVWTALALGIASHGVLDALANYGDGVMFFAPFSTRRYESPWQPFDGLLLEVILLWIPAYLLLRYRRRSSRAPIHPTVP